MNKADYLGARIFEIEKWREIGEKKEKCDQPERNERKNREMSLFKIKRREMCGMEITARAMREMPEKLEKAQNYTVFVNVIPACGAFVIKNCCTVNVTAINGEETNSHLIFKICGTWTPIQHF